MDKRITYKIRIYCNRWQCTYIINFNHLHSSASGFETKTQKSLFSLVRKCWLQSFRSSGGLCTCMSPTSEWIQFSQSQVAKRFFTTRRAFRSLMHKLHTQAAAGLSPGYLRYRVLWFVLGDTFVRPTPFPFLFILPTLAAPSTAVVVESVPPLSFLPEENQKIK
jgi:hypothetical protein